MRNVHFAHKIKVYKRIGRSSVECQNSGQLKRVFFTTAEKDAAEENHFFGAKTLLAYYKWSSLLLLPSSNDIFGVFWFDFEFKLSLLRKYWIWKWFAGIECERTFKNARWNWKFPCLTWISLCWAWNSRVERECTENWVWFRKVIRNNLIVYSCRN